MSGSLTIVVTIVTSAAFALVGVWYVRRLRLDIEGYIVSRNTAGTGVSLATAVASVIGAWILFSPAEAATWSGIAGLSGYALGQAAPLAAMGVLGTRMRALMPNGHGLAEYSWHRYGPLMYVMTLLIMLFYMFVFLSAELTAISLALQLIADIPLYLTAIIVAIATLTYTCYGGLRASIFTDSIQFLLIVPLLLITFVVALDQLGGFDRAFTPVLERAPELTSLNHEAGLAFAVTLIIAILAANLFHQGFWQRVYACRDQTVLRRSYALGALVAIPLVFVAGLFGLLAVGQGVPAEQTSTALFAVAMETLPSWAIIVLLVLAVALVMSSMDTLLNGIASTITTDLARFSPGATMSRLLRSSRLLTIMAAIPAVFVASLGHSVLYLFLIADLVCSAAAFPVFYGMYSKRLSGIGAFVSATAGILLGVLFFPKPDFTPWFTAGWLQIHHNYQFLVSFGSALAISATIALLWSAISTVVAPGTVYDFRRLTADVRLIEG